MKIRVKEHATFAPGRMTKISLATGARAQLDLYCFEPGQEQKPHVHQDQDKIYVVLEGEARVVVDGREETLGPGEAVMARTGAAHGLRNASQEKLLVLVVVAPPPAHA